MSRKQQRGKGRPGGPGGQPSGGGPRPQGGGQPQSPWAQTRDSLRRDVQQAVAALAFAERTGQRLETQRRLYTDFPRVTEALRSGALERLATALGHVYEDGRGQTVDIQRFLRDLPLATQHLAAKERAAAMANAPKDAGAAKHAEAPAAPAEAAAANAEAAAGESPAADAADAAEAPEAEASSAETPAGDAPSADAPAAEAPATEAAATAGPPEGGEGAASAEPAAPEAAAAPAAPAEPAASPRAELRSRLLAAAPQISKAALSFRRNVATLRRACTPRRGPGPWRSDREVLEEARRAVEFVQKMYDTYAEAWADEPLEANAGEAVAAEVDRFLAWTQLDRYAEVALAASLKPSQPPPAKEPSADASKEEPQPAAQ